MKGFIKAAAFAALLVTTGAQAADLSAPAYGGGGYKDGYVADTWWQPGDIFVRVRGLAVAPQTSTSSWSSNVSSIHPDLSISTSGIPEVDFSYFFTKNIAVELIAGVTPHDVTGTGGISSYGKVGEAWLLPPTLTLQYHFDNFGAFKPYVGAGVNYTVFFDQSSGSKYQSFHLANDWGAAVQAGFDYKLQGNWFLNVDFKKLWLESDASVTLKPSTNVTAHVNIDPIIVGAGIGYRFGGYAPLK
jgi:outer membrane protein